MLQKCCLSGPEPGTEENANQQDRNSRVEASSTRRASSKKAKRRSKEEERPKKQHKSKKRKRQETPSITSDSSSDSETEKERRKKKPKQKSSQPTNWEMLEDVWDVEKRPEKYRDEEYVNAIPMETLRHLIAINQSENSSKASDNFEILVKDKKPKPVSFKEASDDGEKMLHPARYLRLPTAKHEEWFYKMPQERRETYISMELDFCGADDKAQTPPTATFTTGRSH